MSKTTEEMQAELVDFYKIAFVVDGDVKFVPAATVLADHPPKLAIELNDSERGKFYIIPIKPN